MTSLAIDGGVPVRTRPFAPWPHFSADEVQAASDVLTSGRVNYWTGSEGRAFEAEFAAAVLRPHAVAVANGTLALELALEALGIGAGDDVVVPAKTFIASASCVVARGARPVVADVDPTTQCLTAETIAAAMTGRTRAIIVVHLGGWPADMRAIMAFARERGLLVVEDCAQSVGAAFGGVPAGSFGDAAAFSFCQDKIMTTGGEGGMLVTSDRDVYERAWSYKDHGKSYALVHDGSSANGVAFRWLHERFGSNWRLTEMQSAIGRAQLRKVDAWVSARRTNAAVLDAGFSAIASLDVPLPASDVHHAYYKYYAKVRPEMLRDGWDRDRIAAAISAEGVPCSSGSCSEIYLEAAFDGVRPAGRLTHARALSETSLMFLVHPTLSSADMEDTVEALDKVMRRAAR